jgi:hypothetical protein
MKATIQSRKLSILILVASNCTIYRHKIYAALFKFSFDFLRLGEVANPCSPIDATSTPISQLASSTARPLSCTTVSHTMVSTAISNVTAQRREPLRPPPPAVVEAEQQWIFTDEELLQSPSILDGMAPEEERTLRRKGVNFILQVGMMLKLPQTTLSTAAVFFNRYLMRNSLKSRPGYKPLHHYVSTLTFLGY